MDVVVIGSVTFTEVVDALADAQETLRREINPVVYSEDDYRLRLAAEESFVVGLSQRGKIFLMGDERELEGLAR